MNHFQRILSSDPQDLEGEDLLLYNLAFQMKQHDCIPWDIDNINFAVSGFEETLDDLEGELLDS